jgi:transposase
MQEMALDLRGRIGMTQEKISRRLRVSLGTVRRWTRKRHKAARVLAYGKSRAPPFSKINPRMDLKIREFVTCSTELIQVPALKSFLEQEMHARVSAPTLARYLKQKLGMSYKRLGVVSPLHNTSQLRLLR